MAARIIILEGAEYGHYSGRVHVVKKAARAAAALTFAVGVNSASVAIQRRWHGHTRVFGSWAPLVNAALIIPPWIGFLAALRTVPKGDLKVAAGAASRVGCAAELVGLLLAVLGFCKLGAGAAINLDHFRAPVEPTASGIYAALDDPIYTGYSLLTAGWALRNRSTSGLALAVLMYVLLTRVLSPVEARVQVG